MSKIDLDIKPIDLAWGKIIDGKQQEEKGRELWLEGAIELIGLLQDARERFSSDQAFGKWLTDSGYGEDRITRQDRAALLNMAEHPDLTREVLEQTHRRSWRHIWEKEVQPRLPHVGQPADAETPEETPTVTRRPKSKRPQKPEWSEDLGSFFSDGLEAANRAIAIATSIKQMTPEQDGSVQKKVTPAWLEKMEQASEAFAVICDWANGSLEKEADALIQQGRIVKTPARRASKPIQPEA
jgi:hypothetical protein